jgi:hypothetical protein
MTQQLTQSAIRGMLKALPKRIWPATVCSLIGHSRIVSACFGYIYCGRCEAQVADKLGGPGYQHAESCVQIGHNCKTCRANFNKMGWLDKWLVPDPFKKKKASR